MPARVIGIDTFSGRYSCGSFVGELLRTQSRALRSPPRLSFLLAFVVDPAVLLWTTYLRIFGGSAGKSQKVYDSMKKNVSTTPRMMVLEAR